jgi:hypothetical protein
MGLVALGLVFIVVRIARRKGNTWLVNANTLSLMVTLYACCFVNFDRVIADYNAAASWEMTFDNAHARLDLAYMEELGPDAIPALEKANQIGFIIPQTSRAIDSLKAQLQSDTKDWRSWTWREQRLLEEIK